MMGGQLAPCDRSISSHATPLVNLNVLQPNWHTGGIDTVDRQAGREGGGRRQVLPSQTGPNNHSRSHLSPG